MTYDSDWSSLFVNSLICVFKGRNRFQRLPQFYFSSTKENCCLIHGSLLIGLFCFCCWYLFRKIHFLSDSHKYWREIGQRIMPGNLRNGSIISLLVEDPRLFRAKTADKQMTTRAPTSNTSLDPPLPYTELFWDIAFQVEQTQKRFTRKELEQKQSGKLQPLTKTPFKVWSIELRMSRNEQRIRCSLQ